MQKGIIDDNGDTDFDSVRGSEIFDDGEFYQNSWFFCFYLFFVNDPRHCLGGADLTEHFLVEGLVDLKVFDLFLVEFIHIFHQIFFGVAEKELVNEV